MYTFHCDKSTMPLVLISVFTGPIPVEDVKKNIETVQGPDVYPAARLMLIHKGKVLEDDTTMEENEVSEDSFFVIMLSKNNSSSAPPPPPTPVAAPPTRPRSSTINSPSRPAEVYLLAGIIHDIIEMGGGRWDLNRVLHALRAASLNPERAVEYLYNGNIPGNPPELPQFAGAPPPPPGPNANPSNLEFLRESPHFQAFRSSVRANPNILLPMLQELVRRNPEMTGVLREHQDEFFRLIFEPVVEEEGDELGRPVSGAIAEPPTVTRADMEALARLEAMGFNRSLVREVFFACDRNEAMAANYLLDHMDEFE